MFRVITTKHTCNIPHSKLCDSISIPSCILPLLSEQWALGWLTNRFDVDTVLSYEELLMNYVPKLCPIIWTLNLTSCTIWLHVTTFCVGIVILIYLLLWLVQSLNKEMTYKYMSMKEYNKKVILSCTPASASAPVHSIGTNEEQWRLGNMAEGQPRFQLLLMLTDHENRSNHFSQWLQRGDGRFSLIMSQRPLHRT